MTTPNGKTPEEKGAAGMNGNGTPPQEVNTHQGATLLNAEEGNGDVTVKQPSPKKRNPASRCIHGCVDDLSTFGRDCAEMAQSVDIKGCCRSTCTVENFKNKFPIIKWLPKYRCPEFQGDFIAGLTVGLTVIPQGLAYAIVAGLPPQYGLYSAFMGCFVYTFFGTSKDVTLGPTAIMSLMTATFAASPVPDVPELAIPLAIVLCLMCGIVQLLMGLFSLGFLVDFIPYPCINSFTCAAAITIGFGQIKSWLGLKDISREFLHQVYETFYHIPETNIYDFILGLVCMIILYIFKRLKNIKYANNEVSTGVRVARKTLWLIGTARNAIVVILASVLAAVLIYYGHTPFTQTRPVPGGLPEFGFPSFTLTYNTSSNATITWGPVDILSHIGIGLLIVPMMGVVESIAIGNAFARVNNYKIIANQELIAIGASNIIGSFAQSYPVTGSFSRTAVNSQSGVKTPAGGIVTGALVLLALALLTTYFQYIPDAALAGVIIMAVLDMVNFQLLRRLWRVKRIDVLPWMVTFILSFVFGVEWGIVAGVMFSLLMLLYPWARPQVKITDRNEELDLQGEIIPRNVMVIRLNQGLLFPGIEYVRDKIMDVALSADQPRSVVLDVQHVGNLDFTTVQGLSHMVQDFEDHNILIVFSGFSPDMLSIMHSACIKGFRYTSTIQEAIRTILEETGCEEDPRQSLLHSANQQPPPIDSDVIEVVAADIEDSPEPEQV